MPSGAKARWETEPPVPEEAWVGGGVGRGQVPQPDRVAGGGGERLAVGREGEAVDPVVVLRGGVGWRRGRPRSGPRAGPSGPGRRRRGSCRRALKATEGTGPPCLRTRGWAAGSAAVRSQSRTVLSWEAEASVVPSGLKAREETEPSCLRRRGWAAGSAAVRSQSRTVLPSWEAAASVVPSGAEGDVVDRAVVPEEAWAGGGVGRGQVPEPDRLVLADGGGERRAVGREGEVVDEVVVPRRRA